MTSAQRMGIAPVNGMIVFDTDSSSLFIYQALPLGWKPLKAMSSLKDLVAGNAIGDVLIWNGTDWVITSFNFFYRDKDGDGHGDQYLTVMSYAAPPGYVSNNLDCNDDDPGNTTINFYPDNDGDGFGTSDTIIVSCIAPPGFANNPNDCNDANSSVNPGATEVTNGFDDDCDGLIDENLLSPDPPDDGFQDTNGDGIDGTETAAIFVSGSGNDGNPGTKALPKRTLTQGIAAAIANAKTHVYVANGTYSERVSLSNGISIYGGYSSTDWSRNASNMANILGSLSGGRVIGIEGINISSPTTVERLWVNTINATSAGTSNYGIYCSNATALILRHCTVDAGNGGNGNIGVGGTNGATGVNGVPGNTGSCDGSRGTGGAGGTSSCSRSGGNGGGGGPEGSNPGINGSAGIGSGGIAGIGGTGCNSTIGNPCAGGPGGDGGDGNQVSNGANGSAGSGGFVAGGIWVGDAGNNGNSGAQGNGGGGGGGGGGQGGSFVDDGGGNGGGGGGAGGCAGTGGTGGSAGGGSFGVFLVNSSGIQMTSNNIRSSTGGIGGSGGNGGIGGNGGLGGNGATACLTEVGKGGNGGDGSKGGNGGHGGGGAGGPSFAVFRSGTSLSLPGSNTLIAGLGGAGGFSNGSVGIAGASGQIF